MMKREYYSLFILSFLYIFLLTAGIPFYWHDYINIHLLSGPWQQNSLIYGFEFAFRPLENIIHFIFFHTFGIVALPFRLLKGLATAGVISFIFFFVEKDMKDTKIAFLAALFYFTTGALLQSVMLIYDFEIIVQFLLLSATYLFFKAYDADGVDWRSILLFTIIVALAIFTKESAKVFLGVLCLFILLIDRRKLKYFVVPLFVLLFLAIKPDIIFGVELTLSASITKTMISWLSIGNFVLFLKYLILSGFGVIIILLWFILLCFRMFKGKIREHKILLFFGLWFLATALLTAVVPMIEKRYAIVPLLPFTLFSFIVIGRLYKRATLKRYLYLVFIFLICMTILFNIGLTLKYRYGFGNFFILLDESYNFTETNYEESIFFYTDTIANFYNFFTLTTNNEYLVYYYFNETIMSNKTIFFYALVDKLQIKEKDKAALEKTFLKGPQCFMLYKFQEKEITEYSLDIKDKQIFSYTFPEKKQFSYCSVSIETRFFTPQEIEVTIVGENENITTSISPPLGKYKSCEYSCPSSGNVTMVKVKADNNMLMALVNRVYVVKLRMIEKNEEI